MRVLIYDVVHSKITHKDLMGMAGFKTTLRQASNTVKKRFKKDEEKKEGEGASPSASCFGRADNV